MGIGVPLIAIIDVVRHGKKKKTKHLTSKLELGFLGLAIELSANYDGKCSNNLKN